MRGFRDIAPGWLFGLGFAVVCIGLVVGWLILRGSPAGPKGTPGVNGSPGPTSIVTLPPVTPSPFVLVVPPGQTATVTTAPTARPSLSPRPTSRPSPTPQPTRTPSPSPTPSRTPTCLLIVCVKGPL